MATTGQNAKGAERNGTGRDPEGTKAAILAAATREFTEKGFGGARIDAIAAHARINKRMLYHYYGGKEALYLAVLEDAYASIRRAEAKLDLAHREPEDGLRELVQFTFHYFVDHPEFLSLLGTENLHKARFLQRSERIVAMNSPLIEELRGVLDRGARKGVFREGADPLDVYLTMAALGFFYLSNRWTLSTVFRRDLVSKGELHRWGEHIADTVARSLKP
ncbi:MAG TPA: TetR/AcrR family transcriptional regulator [Devosia sp.]|jgi:TetR/AcrR family transcriptional regulator|nr:TetR/AcrR family transcriptional regulator [Devosia sp.]